MNSRDTIRALERDGWRRVRVTGDHFHFPASEQAGARDLPHPVRDVTLGTLRSIERQSGLRLRPRP
jgi:predicted RNA binding protein YcfA (HicA-like mRNA interferase family)